MVKEPLLHALCDLSPEGSAPTPESSAAAPEHRIRMHRLFEGARGEWRALRQKRLMLTIDHGDDLGNEISRARHLWPAHILMVEKLSEERLELGNGPSCAGARILAEKFREDLINIDRPAFA